MLRSRVVFVCGLVAVTLAACAAPSRPAMTLNQIAERYVRLVLAVGQHDAGFVDAYYGDPSWQPAGAPRPLADLAADAAALRAALGAIAPQPGDDPLVPLRHTYLDKQLAAVEARLAMLTGTRLSFDEEAARLYDAALPPIAEADFQPALEDLNRLLPGTGSLNDRYTAFRSRYVIPTAKLDAVFRAAIDACRSRTLAHLALPAGETFTVEYVTGKPWSAYNWYKGRYTSVIQVNTDLPIAIDRAIDLACHEGYPGHHVYNALLEQHLVRERGWVEFAVYPLFSPQSLIAEGTANFGIEMAFPGDARTAFERDTLYPLASLNPASAGTWAAVQRAIAKLRYADNEAARRYLNGGIDRAAALAWLQRYGMLPRERAEQRMRFFDQYRSYVINYTLGLDLARTYIEAHGGTPDRQAERWRLFADLLSSPRLPSDLK